jgi:hypothetical protein
LQIFQARVPEESVAALLEIRSAAIAEAQRLWPELPTPNQDRRLPSRAWRSALPQRQGGEVGWWVLRLLAKLAEGLLLLCLESSELCRKRLSVVLGEISESFADLVRHGSSAPANLASIGRQHPEDDPHGGGLAGAVGADEAEHLALGDGERQVVEGDQVAVAAGQAP